MIITSNQVRERKLILMKTEFKLQYLYFVTLHILRLLYTLNDIVICNNNRNTTVCILFCN